jgi:hypothetical protein
MDDLPPATRTLVVDVSAGDADFRGVTDVPASGPVNVLAWRGGQACHLSQDVERRGDMAVGVFDHHFMVTGGRSLDADRVPNTYVGDLTTGAIARLEFGAGVRRSHATVTAFRDPSDPPGPSPALVAGGEDPDSSTSVLSSAEVYMPKLGGTSDVGDLGDFDGTRLQLSEPRTEHGAVVLATGETLLVGGRGLSGLLRSMEIVTPKRKLRTQGVALLAVARKNPTVIRLASAEILVAGGTDGDGNEIPTLEWFSPDASHSTKRPVDLVTGRERAFVPLAAGGALAVILPEKRPADFKTVWVISADGAVEPAIPVDPTTMDVVRLFPGADGAPVLWTGRRWLRWAPWSGAFQPMDDAPATGPALDAIASGDLGLALWLDDLGPGGLKATGYRFDVRTPFDAVPKPLLVQGTDHLAPDRLASSSIKFDATPNGSGLVLEPGASAFIADVTFADVDIDLDIAGASAGRSPPSIVLRQESGSDFEIGGRACALNAVESTVHVSRRGAEVSVTADNASPRTCPTRLDDGTRIAIGLRGSSNGLPTGGRNLRVTRH